MTHRLISSLATNLRLISVLLALLSASAALAGEKPPSTEKPTSTPLLAGNDLKTWRVATESDFAKHGEVKLKDGTLTLEQGHSGTGAAWLGEPRRINYELSLEARRVEGDDFFCGLTFPIRSSYCTLILGGWGGGVTGLSNVDGQSAVENQTTGFQEFKNGTWYKVRLRVASDSIQAWIDDRSIVDLPTAGRKFSIWWEQEPMRPLGIATWNTKAEIRNLRTEPLKP